MTTKAAPAIKTFFVLMRWQWFRRVGWWVHAALRIVTALAPQFVPFVPDHRSTLSLYETKAHSLNGGNQRVVLANPSTRSRRDGLVSMALVDQSPAEGVLM